VVITHYENSESLSENSAGLRHSAGQSQGNGRPLIALRRLLLVLVNTPLKIVNCCSSGSHVSCSI